MSSLPTRPLANTGEKVSLLCLGGGHIGSDQQDPDAMVDVMRYAIDQGVTFLDNAWEYHDGRSEDRMGKAIAGRRDDVFLMTKVCARDRKTALEQLDESLTRLGTDRIDLWQFHFHMLILPK